MPVITLELSEQFNQLSAYCSLQTISRLKSSNYLEGQLTAKLLDCGSIHYILENDGNKEALNSKRNPYREAERQLDSWLQTTQTGTHPLLLIIGFSGLDHIIALAERYSNARIVVIEANPDYFITAMQSIDLSGLSVYSNDIRFIVSSDISQIQSEFRTLLAIHNNFDLKIFLHPQLKRIYVELYNELVESLHKMSRIEAMNRCTNASFSDEWVQNCIINLRYLIDAPGVGELFNKFKNRPAVIVAAGPSLADSLPMLKEHGDKLVKIAVGQSIRALLNEGIDPEFVMAIDSDPITLQQFEGLPEHKSYLLASDSIFTNIIQKYQGQLFGFSNALKDFADWSEEIVAYCGKLEVGGTVTLSAIDMAVRMGCNPIYLTGVDLAFTNDGVTHAKDTMWSHIRKDKKTLVQVPGNYQETVNTSRQFAVYVSIMNRYLSAVEKKYDCQIINVNSAGARFEHCALISPDEWENQLNTHLACDWRIELLDIIKNADKPDYETVINHCQKSLDELSIIEDSSKKCSELLSTIKQMSILDADLAFQEISEEELIIKEQERGIKLLNAAMLGSCMSVLSDDNIDPIEQSKNFYTQMNGAASWLKWLLDNFLDNYSNKKMLT